MDIKPGTTGTYVSTNGYQKAAQVIETQHSVDPDGELIQPADGHVHIVIWSHTAQHYIVRPNVPLRAVAEELPDYFIDGKLVGYFEAN